MTIFADNDGWDYALQIYAAPGVASACLELQERHGIDVTAMLFCLWLGKVRAEPLGDHLPGILATAREWHRSVVAPARAARRRIKVGSEGLESEETAALYRVLLAAEIECEHAEFLILARHAEKLLGAAGRSGAPLPVAVVRNLADFLRDSGVSPGPVDRAALETLLAATGAKGEVLGAFF